MRIVATQRHHFAGWIGADRIVCAGQKARWFLVNEETGESRAIFDFDQTEPLEDPVEVGTPGWILVSRDEYYAGRNQSDKRPHARVNSDGNGGVSIWVGSNKKAIKWLQDRGYHFAPRQYRWKRKDRDPAKVAAVFEEQGFRVTREYEPNV